MKRIVTILIVILIAGSMSAFAQAGTTTTTNTQDPEVLIDFNNLTDTEIDFSNTAGAGLAEADKANLKVDLKVENWQIVLASSSQVGANQALSYASPATTTSDSKTVLGARIHYPDASFNSYAIIKPPFDIPAYEDKPGDTAGTGNKFTGKGILKNVGTLKYIEMNVNGRNFPYGIGIIIEDQNNEERIIFVDYLRYTGWKTLVWKNPNYITDVKNREMQASPLYPRSQPYIKFKGFIIYRDGSQVGGDFVTYIKDVKIAYDKAVTSDYELDVNDEAVWHILRDREEKRKVAEEKRLGNLQVLRYLEKKKMYEGREPTDTNKTK
jgi:hypothetical protein